jgi:hypothetical protein
MKRKKEEFDKWIIEHSVAVSDGSCLVLDHKIDTSDFALTLSSKTLLNNTLEQSKYADSILFIDTTYKIINSGLVLMVAGTQTLEHQFRPIAFQIALKEDTIYYERFLAAIKEGVKEKLNKEFLPKYIMSDFDESIAAAARSVFPDSVQLKCYFHLKRNLERKIRECGLKDQEETILEDLKFLSESTDIFEFDQLVEMFLSKIREMESRYFE